MMVCHVKRFTMISFNYDVFMMFRSRSRSGLSVCVVPMPERPQESPGDLGQRWQHATKGWHMFSTLVYSPYTSQNSTTNLGACICQFLFKGALIALAAKLRKLAMLWWLSFKRKTWRSVSFAKLSRLSGWTTGWPLCHKLQVLDYRYWTSIWLIEQPSAQFFSYPIFFQSWVLLSLMCLVIFNVTGLLGTIPSVHEIDTRQWVPLTGSLQ